MIKTLREKRKKAIRSKVAGSSTRPRLSVFRSSKHIYASLIDDEKGETILWVSSEKLKDKGTKSDKAFLVGQTIAEKASKKGFNEAVFDRNGFLYHGRVRRLAEGAREKGLKF